MIRLFLSAAAAIVFGAIGSGQSLHFAQPQAIQTAPKHGGTFRVATGTWTRDNPTIARAGVNDVIYNNTANAHSWTTGGMSAVTESFQFVDEGRIPSNGAAGTANRDNYNINTITVGYCINTNGPSAADLLITIYGSYMPCTDPAMATCSGEFLATGLPGASPANVALGYVTCWTVDFDLSGGQEICVLGDADGTYNADPDFDSFGIGLEFDPSGLGGYVGSHHSIGPMLAGDPKWTVQVAGTGGGSPGGVPGCPIAFVGGGGDTDYGPAECCVPTLGGDNSTGLGNQDFNWVGDRSSAGAAPGCYWFGYSNPGGCNADPSAGSPTDVPFSGMHVKIEADQSANCVPTLCSDGPGIINSFCEAATSNSSGAPATLTASWGSGFQSDLHLDVSGGPLPLANGSRMLGYFIAGDIPSLGISTSDGMLCLLNVPPSRITRYNVVGTAQNSISAFDATGNLQNMVGTGGTSGYGFDVPFAINMGGVPTTIMAGDTYAFQCWYRDTDSGLGRSNFSTAALVSFR